MTVVRYWSCIPGKFVDARTGGSLHLHSLAPGPSFMGKPSDWYVSLVVAAVTAASEAGIDDRVTLRAPDSVFALLEGSNAFHVDASGMLYGTFGPRRVAAARDDSISDDVLIVSAPGLFTEACVKVLDLRSTWAFAVR